jgi:two-component system, cell cycle sensor histidine kinase and response regulator CckA
MAETKPSLSRWIPTRGMAAKIALCYALVGALWILCSGQVLHHFVRDLALQELLENVKGWLFVGVTALILGVALGRYFREIRRSAQLLQATEERWQFALHGAGQSVWDWNAQTDEVFRSAGWKALFGFGAQEIGDSVAEWRARVHPEDLPRVQAEIQRHFEGQTPMYSSEHRIRCKDGSYKWVLGQGRIISHAPDGKPLRVVGTYSDISERKRAEEALQQSEAQFRAMFELASIGMTQAEPHTGRWLRANQKMCTITGYSAEEMLRMRISDVSHPEDRQHDWEMMQRVVRGDAPDHRVEKRYVRKDGSLAWVNVNMTVIRDATGQPLRTMATVEDITERKRAEVLLQESLLFRRQAERIGRVGAWKASPKTDSLYWTEGVYEIVEAPPHYKPGLEEGMKLYDAESIPQLREGLQRALADGTPFVVEAGLTTMKGKHIWTEVRGLGRLGDHEQAFVMGTFHDITERKRLESELRQSQKLEAIGRLAGGVAHDFNNILAVIMMHLGLLQMNATLDPKSRQAIRDLDAASRRAASLTRQLLMFSRRSVLAVKPLDLNEVVTNLLKMLRRLIGEHVDLRFDGKSALPLVEADAGMLEQVLMNLAVNARDAMPKGGKITISTLVEDLNAAEAAVHPSRRPGRFVCLAVADAGCGMDSATMKRIFEPFFTTKDPGKGTGLGLATVHGIVAQHKGWVEVESAVGHGTTFQVYLPASAQTNAEALPTTQTEYIRRGRETILLVEDELQLRQVGAESLRALGYQVHEAANGQEAMTLWQVHGSDVDLLLTDMVMPEGMTGLELTEQLQARKPGLKAIISSGYSEEIVNGGVPGRLGIVYLPKPYATKVLAGVIRDCLDQKN